MNDLEARALGRTWFYRFQLPSGRCTESYDNGTFDLIHDTRMQMLEKVLQRGFPSGLGERTAVDLACHQGWFASRLAQAGAARVLGVDARAEHVADATLIRDLCELRNLEFLQSDVHALDAQALGSFDVVLCFGLLYHLENPIGALRTARALCKRVCVVETQVVPGVTGVVDWGSYRFARTLQGCFGLIDESEDVHGPESSTTGICLAPSVEGLEFVLRKVGFDRVERLPVPAGGYEQLLYGKRVMMAAWVD